MFPKLNDADTKFKAEGEYSVKLSLKAEEPATKAFIAKLAPLHDAAVTKAEAEFKGLKVEARKKLGKVTVNPLFSTVYDQETEQPTGDIEFKFAAMAGGIVKKTGKRWARKPAIFDAKGTILKNAPAIWGGTIGKVSFTVNDGGYFIPGTGAAGLSLRLEAVQIIELRSGGGGSASDHGFGEEEGFDGSSQEFASEDPGADGSEGAAGDENGDF